MGMVTQSSREAETTLNQLLSEMDGFEDSEGIIVMAATNLIQNIDPAILRPGRFDHKIEITLPTADERKEILKIYLKEKKHSLNAKGIEVIVERMINYSGAEIENVVN